MLEAVDRGEGRGGERRGMALTGPRELMVPR
jgi:hypothetical protein